MELVSSLVCYSQAGSSIILALGLLSPRIRMSAGDAGFVHMKKLLIYQQLLYTH